MLKGLCKMNVVNVETLRVRSQLSIIVFFSYDPLKNSHYVHRNLRSYELSEKKMMIANK